MTDAATAILDQFAARGIRLERRGDKVRFTAPPGIMTPETLAVLREHKAAILAHLAPTPSGCAWRVDERDRLIFSDGAIYSPTHSGGWILTQHPTRRLIAPGTLAADAQR